jgi:predicted dehydrogenase
MAATHGRGYINLPNARVVGVMDTNRERGEHLAALGGTQYFADFDEMMKAAKPDIVDVCVPTPVHADYVCRAAAYKPKGIVVEKPMALTVADCERMIQACGAAGVPLFVAHVLRFFPEFATAKAQVDSGAVGKPAAVRTRRGGPLPRGTDNWFAKPAESGGCILDLIIHDFDWLRWTFGEVERVYAKGIAASHPEAEEVERDYALVTLRFASGVVAHVEGTWADPGGFKVAFEIAGDGGLLEYNFNQPAGAPLVSALGESESGRAAVPVPESPVAANPYQAELAHFLDSLERGVPAMVTGRDGLEAVRIGLAAIEAARTNQVVTLGR